MIKKTLAICILMLILMEMAVIPMAAENKQTYHDTLITHWDFEGEGDEAYRDKAGSGTEDNLTVHGDKITVENGMVHIPTDAGHYLSASGKEGSDLYDLKNKTIVIKAELINHPDGRNVLASFAAKKNGFAWGVQNESSKNICATYIGMNGKMNMVNSTLSAGMNEFRMYAVTFRYDETGKKLTATFLMSTKELPEDVSDFEVVAVQEIVDTTGQGVVASGDDFLLGRRYDQLDKDRKIITYIDDVKVYSSVLSIDEIIADCPDLCVPVKAPDPTDLVPNPEVHYDILDGIKMYAMGDSYFYGSGIGTNKAWPSILAKKYNMDYLNNGVGGSTVGVYDGYPENKVPMVLRYDEALPAGDVDLILFEGGRNDRSRKVPIGTDDSKDIYTFKGGLNVTLDGLQKKFPNAVIICVTPWNVLDSNGASEGYHGTTADYAAAMVELCAKRNVPVINAADTRVIPVDMNNAEFRSRYCIKPGDHSHLNEEGMKMVLPYFEKEIVRLYCQAKGVEFVDQTPTTPGGDADDKPADNGGNGQENTPPSADTAAPEVTDTADTEAEKKGGCRSALTSGAFVVAGAGIAGVAVALPGKKKKRSGGRTDGSSK